MDTSEGYQDEGHSMGGLLTTKGGKRTIYVSQLSANKCSAVLGLNSTYCPSSIPNAVHVPLRGYNARKPHVLFDANIFRVFIPCSIKYVSSIMTCLDFTPKTVPICQYQKEDSHHPGRQLNLYGLDESWYKSMSSAEFIQRSLIKFLENYIGQLPLDLDIEQYYEPARYGYKLWWDTRHQVITAAMRAQTAFISRWAYVAFLVCLASERDKPDVKRPAWVEQAIPAGYMSNDVWTDINRCWVFRSDGRRVGGFVRIYTNVTTGSTTDHTMTQWFDHLTTIVKRMHELPLWLVYPNVKHPERPHEVAKRYWPTADEWEAVKRMWMQTHRTTDVLVYTPTTRPPTRDNVTWFEYIDRLHQWIDFRQSTSDGAPPEAANTLCYGPSPAGHVARVYFWEIGLRNGQECWSVSFLSNPNTIKQYWDMTYPEGRVYNVFTGEWDICCEIVPDNVEQLERFVYNEEEEDYTPAIDEQTIMAKLVNHLMTAFHALHQVEAVTDQIQPEATTINVPALEWQLPWRYSLLASTEDTSVDKAVIDDILRLLKPDNNTEQVPANLQASMYRFFASIRKQQVPSSTCCDWSLSANELQSRYPPQPLKITQVRDGWIIDSVDEQGCSPNPQDAHWLVYVNDPLTVMQIICCQWGPTKVDVARALLKAGIPWRMLRVYDVKPRVVDPRRSSVSALPINVTASGDEHYVRYTVYDDLRYELLLQPRTKVALQYGGILWRLGREVIDIEQVLMAGTSNDLWHAFMVPLANGKWGVGDGLSEEEIEIIVGMYCTYNHINTPLSGDITKRSWWPTLDAWESTGYNYGYWTHVDENWYTSQRSRIFDSSLKHFILRRNEWRRQLIGDRRWKPLRDAITRLATKVVNKEWIRVYHSM